MIHEMEPPIHRLPQLDHLFQLRWLQEGNRNPNLDPNRFISEYRADHRCRTWRDLKMGGNKFGRELRCSRR